MVHRIAITNARHNLGQIVRRVHLEKEHFVLEKNGIPIAGLINIDDFEDWLELQNAGLQNQIKEGYEAYRQGRARPAREFLSELHSELARGAGKVKTV